jgi:N-acetylglucosaminyl-diphospho-decaprenol L-rhamnosyltransferase
MKEPSGRPRIDSEPRAMSAPTVSIIIVNWNTRDLLADSLESVYATMVGDSFDVFVVDNASTDDSVAMVRAHFPEVYLIQNSENLGFARANNQAMVLSKAEYVLLLNSDAVLLPGAMDYLISFLRENPQAGAVGPRLLNGDGSIQPSCHPMLTPWREFWRLSFLDRILPLAGYPFALRDGVMPRRVDVLKGACILFRRAALEKVGLFDEGYFMYTEEMDLCLRLAHAGWHLYWTPAARVIHYGGQSTGQIPAEMYIELYRSKMRFHTKFGGQRRASYFRLLLFSAYLPRYLCSRLMKDQDRAQLYRQLLQELPRM